MLITCPYCKESINQSLPACPHCGRSRIAPQQPRDVGTGRVRGNLIDDLAKSSQQGLSIGLCCCLFALSIPFAVIGILVLIALFSSWTK